MRDPVCRHRYWHSLRRETKGQFQRRCLQSFRLEQWRQRRQETCECSTGFLRQLEECGKRHQAPSHPIYPSHIRSTCHNVPFRLLHFPIEPKSLRDGQQQQRPHVA